MTRAHPIEAYYSLIQFCPDRGRAEGVNLGAVLFVPHGEVVVREAHSLKRVQRVYGVESPDLRHLGFALRAFVSSIEQDHARGRFRSLQEWAGYVESRAGDFLLTEPKGMSVDAVSDAIELIMTRYVEPPAAMRHAAILERMSYIDREMTDLAHEKQIVKIAPVIEVADSFVKLKTDYSFQNGVLNLVQCVRAMSNPSRSLEHAVDRGGRFMLLKKHIDREAKLVYVVEASDGLGRDIVARVDEQAEEIAAQFEATVWRSSQAMEFVQHVRESAH